MPYIPLEMLLEKPRDQGKTLLVNFTSDNNRYQE